MANELIDCFDENMRPIGIANREVAHSQGLWHQTFHCWLIRRTPDGMYLLFQRRGPEKAAYPNTLDITAAGHLSTGETPEDGVREISEELGLAVQWEDLIPLGIRCDVAVVGKMVIREFCHTYLLESNIALSEYHLQSDEVSGIVQMEVCDGLRMFSGESTAARVTGYQVQPDGRKTEVSLEVTPKDIIPRLDRYYLKVLIMAERYFEGEKHLGI